MPNGVSKLQLLIDLKNKLKAGLDTAKQQVSRATGQMQSKLDAFKAKNIAAFDEIKNQMPEVANAMGLLKNPLLIAGAALAAVGLAARQALAEAAQFSAGFRELNMLNIDKSVKEMKELKKAIRETAFEKGFDPTQTIRAFFDVQSTTGKYGNEVDRIVAKQGEFAKLMQADFNNWIAGTSKAMANFGFGAERLDAFNRSAFATVKTGVTTFDELSKVMSVYAGAAASARQDFEAANKLFSIFTVKVKSVDEAATLTKSLFTDLSKAETIASFKKIGIDLFDVNDKFKQADTILLELNKKFIELGDNDSRLIDLKNQFTGSEGLIAFIQAAMDKTGQLQGTINTFDSSAFSLPKAMEIAKNDINYINDQLENRTKVVLGEIGDKLMPIVTAFTKIKLGILEGFREMITPTQTKIESYKKNAANDIAAIFPQIDKVQSLSDIQFKSLIEGMREQMAYYGNLAEQNKRGSNPSSRLFHKSEFEAYNSSNAMALLLQQNIGELLNVRGKMSNLAVPSGDFTGVPTKPTETTNGGMPVSDTLTKDTKAIVSGSQSKNITINIDSFVKGFSPTSQSISGMNKDELERWMTEMFLRVVRSAETAI